MKIRESTLADASALGRVQLDSWRTLLAPYANDDYFARFSYEQRAAS